MTGKEKLWMAGGVIWLPLSIFVLPAAWIWSMLTDFTHGAVVWVMADFFFVPVGVVRGLGFWFGWWAP